MKQFFSQNNEEHEKNYLKLLVNKNNQTKKGLLRHFDASFFLLAAAACLSGPIAAAFDQAA